MKVRELNALLNKLGKDKEVILTIPGLAGPDWEDPAVYEASDGVYIVPKSIEDRLESAMTKEQIAAETTKFHQQALKQGDTNNAGGQSAGA